MKYFYDTEFHEDGTTIDLISIGIVAEDGREYYAVNRDADWDRIQRHQWLMENVVPQLLCAEEWKPKAQIVQEVQEFLLPAGSPADDPDLWAWFSAYDHVVLAQLWGPMVGLPQDIPMYTHDLRAYVDYLPDSSLPTQANGAHDALEDARWVKLAHDYAVSNNPGLLISGTTTEWGVRRDADTACYSLERAQRTIELQRKRKLKTVLIKRQVGPWELAEP